MLSSSLTAVTNSVEAGGGPAQEGKNEAGLLLAEVAGLCKNTVKILAVGVSGGLHEELVQLVDDDDDAERASPGVVLQLVERISLGVLPSSASLNSM